MNITATFSAGGFEPGRRFNVKTENDVGGPLQQIDTVLQRQLVVVKPLSQFL